MNFGTNKTPVEVINEGAFGETYFSDIYSVINGKWYRKSWKEFRELKNIDKKYFCSNNYDSNIRFWENMAYKYEAKCATSFNFEKIRLDLIYRSLWLVSMLFLILVR